MHRALLLALAACAADPVDTTDSAGDSAGGDGKADGFGTAPGRSFETYRAIVEATGGEVGGQVVLGIRGIALDGTRHATTSVESFDDTFVVLAHGQAIEL